MAFLQVRNIFVTKYEDLVSSQNKTIRSILTFAQIENITDEEIENGFNTIRELS